MSLSLLERLTLVVHPHRVVLERRGWRGIIASRQAPVAAAGSGEADWQPALAAATALLDGEARPGAALRVIVADHFVRYALLPWDARLCSRKARQAMAQALFADMLGERAAGHALAVDAPAFGCNGIAAGIDGALLAGLRATARARRLRLASVKPRLVAELAGWRPAAGDGWFAALDRGWLTLAGLRRGRPLCLQSFRTGHAEPAALAAEIAGWLTAGAASVGSQRLYLCCRETMAPQRVAGFEPTLVPSALPGAGHV